MIGIIDVQVQAASPNIPLAPVRSFTGAPSSIRVRNVPRSVGKWSVTAVSLTYTLPNNTTGASPCVLTGGIWVGSVPACATAGTVTRGLTVVASGTDQTGAAVIGYILGVANIEILAVDASVAPGVTKYALRFCQTAPATPAIGDVAYFNDVLKFYDGTQWKSLGGGGSVTLDDTVTETSSNGVKSSGIWSFVKGLLPTWLTPSYAEPATVASVTAETTRATASEATKADASALTAEVTRATAAEATKADASALTAEVNRATAAEATKADASALTAEVNRATASEATKRDKTDIGAYKYQSYNGFSDEVDLYDFYEEAGDVLTWKGPLLRRIKYDRKTSTWSFFNYDGVLASTCIGTENALSITFPPTEVLEWDLTFVREAVGTGVVADGSKTLVRSFATVGTQTPTVANGVADLSSLFTRDDTSGEVNNSALEEAIDYNLTGSGQSPMNRSVTVLDATSAGVTITLPTIGVGITDLEYWVVMGETTQSVSVPASVQWKDGKAPVASDYKANSTHVFHFTAKKPDAAATEVITGVMGVFATPA